MVVHRKKYRPWDPQAYRQQPFRPDTRLPDDDLVFFLLDLLPQLDLEDFYASYEVETRGAPPFQPAMLICPAAVLLLHRRLFQPQDRPGLRT